MEPQGKWRRFLFRARYRSRHGGHSVARQCLELATLRILRGLGPDYYQIAGFWDPKVPWADKMNHCGTRRYDRLVRNLNPPQYQKVSQNKVTEKAVLALFSVPTPRFLGFLDPVRGYAASGAPLRSVDHLQAFLQTFRGDRLCFKLPEGWAGKSFLAAEVMRGASGVSLRLLQHEASLEIGRFAEEILGLGQGSSWLMEEYLDQHPWYHSIHPSSVNTMRLLVLKRHVSDYGTVIGGYLRMGRGGSMVDNRQAGGIVAAIDLHTGVLHPAGDGVGGIEAFESHPDTGTRIAGVVLPFWEESKALAVKAVNLFPEMRYAGLDVAVTLKGPVIIEMNVDPSVQGAAITAVPLGRIST